MREVVLRLALRNYERARELADAVAERAERTLGRVRGVSTELRGALDRAEKLNAAERAAPAARRRGDSPDLQDLEAREFGRVFSPVNRARERAEALGRVLQGESPAQTLRGLLSGAAPFVAGVGPLLAVLAPLTSQLFTYLEERLQTELDKREERLLARLGEERFLADYNRRLAEDPRFARAEARRALEETLREEALRGKRLEPYSADLALSDFGF